MAKSEEEIKKELDQAREAMTRESAIRKLGYAQVEYDMMMKEKKQESLKVFYCIVQRYNISGDDIIALLDVVPYL